MPKRTFVLSVEADELWRRLSPTRGASSESGALQQFLFDLDQSLRQRLDAEGLALYEACALNRSEMNRAFQRHRARKAAANGNGEKQPAVV
jgi:hypothetical protein